jgi:serine/threonine protein kinase/tetratricopeptide (TPR) repeat protein
MPAHGCFAEFLEKNWRDRGADYAKWGETHNPEAPMTEREIFDQALDIHDPAQRDAFLVRACADQPYLRWRVNQLLKAHEQAGEFLNQPHPAAGADQHTRAYASQSSPTETAGTIIAGKYKLLQRIGEGGMGSVWMADQLEPVKRRVAVKVIRAERDGSRTILSRFEAERQAIALMDHPHIAKLLDAGTTDGPDSPRPYFVMELVKGVPLTEFCDEHKLSILDRLNLFTQICSAVQHAHQKGIIHRDLKPTNILVELHDDKPVPKVIDFGLAKAMSGQPLTEHTLFTGFGTVAGTPLYMAPEQATFSAIDIDTRTDIYALGIILYELLTGSTPIERGQLKKAALDEVLRVIREQEPPTPSKRLSSSESKPSVAANRQMEPAKLGRFLRGELDWIVMKALSKERDRRYETANGFAKDIERFQQHEPVLAGPPSAGYKLRKFVQRNRPRVIAGSLVLLALVAGIIGTSRGLIEAKRQEQFALAAEQKAAERAVTEANERRRAESAEAEARRQEREAKEEAAIAEAVNDFLQNDLLSEAAPDKNARNKKVTVEEVLGRAAARVAGKFDHQPRVEAAIRDTIGNTYRRLGKYAAAQPHLERALEIDRRVLGEEHRDTLSSKSSLGLLFLEQGNFSEAETLLVQALETRRRIRGEEHPETLRDLGNLAHLHLEQGQLADAEPLYVEMVEGCRRVLGEEHSQTLSAMNDLAEVYQCQGRFAEAEPLLVKTLDFRRARGEESPETLNAMHNLASIYHAQRQFAKAEPLYIKGLEISCRVKGEEHPDTLNYMNNLALLYLEQGQFDKAEPLCTKALEISARVLGEEHPHTLTSLNNLAVLYWNLRQLDRSIPLFVKALTLQTRKLGADHPDTIRSAFNLGVNYGDGARLDDAVAVFDEWLARAKTVLKPGQPAFDFGLRAGSDTYARAGRYEKAEPLCREVLEQDRLRYGKSSLQAGDALRALGESLMRQKKYSNAEPFLRECLAIREREQPDAWTTFNSKSLLGEALVGQKNYDTAEPLLLEGYEGMTQREAKIPMQFKALRLREALQRVVQLYDAWGKPDEAAKWRAILEKETT